VHGQYGASLQSPLTEKQGGSEEMTGKSIGSKVYKALVLGCLLFFEAQAAYAEATSEADLGSFLEGIGDFLIKTVGPAVLVIGIAVAGISIALGDEQGMRRGTLAAAGGALILLSRAILDFITHIAHF
jgi:type IV secretory pathway VirB2 component (pilin)